MTSLITNQLSALREHIVMKNLKVYPSLKRQQPPSSAHPTPDLSSTPAPSRLTQRSPSVDVQSQQDQSSSDTMLRDRIKSEPNLTPYAGPLSSDQSALTLIREIPQPEAVSTPVDSHDVEYIKMAKEKAMKLISSANATESDGWAVVGTKNNVHIMKLLPRDGTSLNCVKGTGPIHAPPTFIMKFLRDSSHTTELDDMLKETRAIHVVSDTIQLVHMLYKAVWPTSPRDFAILNIYGQFDERTWISAAVSIQDPRIPHEKGHVRGHLETGGYVIQAVSGNPNVSHVTYVAQVDLGGSIPSMVVNRIADSQPQCVNRMRNLVEPLYRQLSQDPQSLQEFEDKIKICKVIPDQRSLSPSAPGSLGSQNNPTVAVHRSDNVEPLSENTCNSVPHSVILSGMSSSVSNGNSSRQGTYESQPCTSTLVLVVILCSRKCL